MKIYLTLIACLISLAMSACSTGAFAGPLDEERYCGEVKRDANGEIARSKTVYRAFRKIYPCPSTMSTTGACPGWQADHVIPLACGGCDAVSNIQWLPIEIKATAGDLPKDRWERKIYCK